MRRLLAINVVAIGKGACSITDPVYNALDRSLPAIAEELSMELIESSSLWLPPSEDGVLVKKIGNFDRLAACKET